MFKKQSLIEDEECFYQNKIRLQKNNLYGILIGKVSKLYCVTFQPIKNEVFRSSTLKYYFYSSKEMVNFILKHQLFQYLNINSKNLIVGMIENSSWNLNNEEWKETKRFACPCCGQLTYYEKPNNTFRICPVCYWEDDLNSVYDLDYYSRINKSTLNQAKKNYQDFGACKEEYIKFVRKPNEYENVRKL